MNQRNFLVSCWAFWLYRLQHSDNVTDFRYYADMTETAQETMFSYFRFAISQVFGE